MRAVPLAVRINTSRTLIILASIVLVIASTYFAVKSATALKASLPGTTASTNSMVAFGYPWQPQELELVTSDAAFIVKGEVQEILPAVWTTGDGNPPQDIRNAFEQATSHVRTPVRFAVERVYKGTNVPDTLEFSVYGGTMVDTAFTTEELMRLKQGATLVVFLNEHAQLLNVSSRLFPNLFFVVDGDVARGPARDISMSDLERQIQ